MIPLHHLPWLMLACSLIPGILIFFIPEHHSKLRTVLNLTGASLKIVLVLLLFLAAAGGTYAEIRLPLLPGVDLRLLADPMSLLFVSLSALLWLITTIYAIGYLEHAPNRSRFFGFFSLCVSSTAGIALAGNLFTFLVFYEMLTLSTYPLVVHRGTEKSLAAGKLYLGYTLVGGALLLLGMVWLRTIAGPIDFVPGGFLRNVGADYHGALMIIFFLLIAGLGVKAALVPFHGWLPQAMVAPAPVSALLHAVAVVKAGAFGIVRVIYDVYGVTFAEELKVLLPLTIAASITIIYGSVRALYQQDIKRRLAFSTVSQVSYIALGASIFGPMASIGGILHLVHQGIMKITLFFCAGNFAEATGIHAVDEMKGIGRRMPLTMAAFTIGALGMIGVPPIAGFVTKWYLGAGALLGGDPWVLAVLIGSSALNAAYFLPLVYAGWFQERQEPWPDDHPHPRFEIGLALLAPPVITAILSILIGVFADSPFSPLSWVRFIVAREYVE